VTEYCAVIATHSTVWGDKLLYGHIPDPFPQCGIGSWPHETNLCDRDTDIIVYVQRSNTVHDANSAQLQHAMGTLLHQL